MDHVIVRSSKFFLPEESRHHVNSWWFQLPEGIVTQSNFEFIHLLCQKTPTNKSFYHLKVPINFLMHRKADLNFLEKSRQYSLILCAEEKDTFVELRGKGKIDFSKFIVHHN